MSTDRTSRQFCLAALAVQANLIQPRQMAEACSAWIADPEASLADRLVERGWLSSQDRLVLEERLAGAIEGPIPAGEGSSRQDGDDPDRQRSTYETNVDLPWSQWSQPTTGVPTSRATAAADPNRYVRARLHATGGLGCVWLARDAVLDRDVALKEIRPEQTNNPLLQQRFLKEARITGRLEHPGIVPIYELVGPREGESPFYTMRFIKGRTLTEAIRACHQGPTGGVGGRRELHELLQAFAGVCQAVGYAHSRGVIHRDLKGQNVVLGDFGEVIVLDWGLAKVQGERTESEEGKEDPSPGWVVSLSDSAEKTLPGQVLGTPAYMAPEQARGRNDLVNERSDVYSLGAILYEILTEQPPFAGSGGVESLLNRVRHDVPVRPRVVRPGVPPALDAICCKALAGKPEDRYASAVALLRDVQQWLADEPVSAYAEPWPLRARRWMRRHRTLVTSSAAVLVLAVLSVTVLAVVLKTKNTQLVSANEREREAREQAETNFTLAKGAVDEYLNAVRDDPLLRQADFNALRRKLLSKAVPFYEKFAAQRSDDPDQEGDYALVLGRLAELHAAMGDIDKALAGYEQMRDRFAHLVDNYPAKPVYRKWLAISQNNVATHLLDLQRWSEAETVLREALVVQTQLVNEFPDNRSYRHRQATVQMNLGIVLQKLHRLSEAREAYDKAITGMEKLVAKDPTAQEHRAALASSLHNLGLLLVEQNRPRDAEAAFHEAVRHYEQVTALSPPASTYRKELALAHYHLGILCHQQRRYAEAETAYRASLAIAKPMADDFPSVAVFRVTLASIGTNLGDLLKDLRRWPEAEAALREALLIEEKLAADFPLVSSHRSDLSRVYRLLGELLATQGKRDEAEKAFRQALPHEEKLVADFRTVPKYRLHLAATQNNLGTLLWGWGRKAEAESMYRQALKTYQQLDKDFPGVPLYRENLAGTYGNLGSALQTLDRLIEAEAAQRRSLAILQELVEQFPEMASYRRKFAETHINLGSVLRARRCWPESEAALRQAVQLLGRLATEVPGTPTDDVRLSQTYLILGCLMRDRGDSEAAMPWFATAIGTLTPLAEKYKQLWQARQFLCFSHAERAVTWEQLGRPAEALLDWNQTLILTDRPNRAHYQSCRAAALALAGQTARAIAEAKPLSESTEVQGRTLYALARVWSLAAAAVKDDPPLQERHAARAVALLTRARAQGHFLVAANLDCLKKDKDFASLRSRADFRKLLADCEARPASK